MESKELKRIRRHAERAMHARGLEQLPDQPMLGPKASGTSQLEVFEGTLIEKAREIQRLAASKDDPLAWADLANGFRVATLREPIKEAILSVEWRRVHKLVCDHPGGWPRELLQWFEKLERDEAEEIRRPHIPKPYLPGDYGIEDI